MNCIDPGQMDRTILIRRLTVSQDSEGAPTESYSTYATLWASKKDLAQTERDESSNKRVAIGQTSFVIWYRGDLRMTDLVQLDSVDYDIKSIREVGYKEFEQIIAEVRE